MRLSPKGHASLDPGNPSAFGYCDCCKFLYVLRDLNWQMEYAGKELRNTGFLHCPTCLSPPNPQGIAITVPADPVPVRNARPND
jgi:hypothetical protein